MNQIKKEKQKWKILMAINKKKSIIIILVWKRIEKEVKFMQNKTNEGMKKIKEILENNTALEHAITLLSWDLETEAPALAAEKISKTLGYLTGESYSMIINDEFKKLIYGINTEELSEIDRKIIEEVKKESFEKMENVW